MSKAKYKLGKYTQKHQMVVIINQKDNGVNEQGVYEYQGSRDEVHCKMRRRDAMGILVKCKRVSWCNPCCNVGACLLQFIPKVIISAKYGLDLEHAVIDPEVVK